jgi:hypothetical protein
MAQYEARVSDLPSGIRLIEFSRRTTIIPMTGASVREAAQRASLPGFLDAGSSAPGVWRLPDQALPAAVVQRVHFSRSISPRDSAAVLAERRLRHAGPEHLLGYAHVLQQDRRLFDGSLSRCLAAIDGRFAPFPNTSYVLCLDGGVDSGGPRFTFHDIVAEDKPRLEPWMDLLVVAKDVDPTPLPEKF